MSLPAGQQGSPAVSSSYSEPNENEAGFEMANGSRREGPDLTNESRSLSLVDLQDSSPSDGLDDGQWQLRTGLLPLSFQNPVYHMTATSPRQPMDATPSDGSAGSQGNPEDRNTIATKPAFLTQMSVALGGGERVSAMSSSSSGEEYSRRALSDTLTGTTGDWSLVLQLFSPDDVIMLLALRLPRPISSDHLGSSETHRPASSTLLCSSRTSSRSHSAQLAERRRRHHPPYSPYLREHDVIESRLAEQWPVAT